MRYLISITECHILQEEFSAECSLDAMEGTFLYCAIK